MSDRTNAGYTIITVSYTHLFITLTIFAFYTVVFW